jgi:hypothetical protein
MFFGALYQRISHVKPITEYHYTKYNENQLDANKRRLFVLFKSAISCSVTNIALEPNSPNAVTKISLLLDILLLVYM